MAFTPPTRTVTFTAEDVATLDHYASNVAFDQIFQQTPLLALMYRSVKQPGLLGPSIETMFRSLGITGQKTDASQSGIRVEMPLSVGSSTNTQWFYRGSSLSTNVDEGLTRAESLWAYLTDYCALYRTDVVENSGPGKALDRAREQLDQMMRSKAQTLYTALWSTQGDVVHGSQDKVPGIQAYIPTTTTSGTMWGVSRSSPNTFWRNNADTVGSFAANGLTKLSSMTQSCAGNGGADPVSLIITDATTWGYMVAQLEAIHRVTDFAKEANTELSSKWVRYRGIPVMWDTGCPSGYAYFLNFNYMKMFVHKDFTNYIEHPANPNDRLVAQQTRVASGLTWGIQRPDRFGVLSGITA